MRELARIAVVLSTNHQAHYGFASESVYRDAGQLVPWVQLEFFTEERLCEFVSEVSDSSFDGIVFGSGSLQSVSTRRLLGEKRCSEALGRAFADQVGFAFLHQLLPPGSSFEVDFLSPESAFVLQRGTARTLNAPIHSDGLRLSIRPQTSSAGESLHLDVAGNTAIAWHVYQPHFRDRWKARLWPDGAADQPLMMTYRGRGQILLSSLALDWNGNVHALASIIARAARSRGVLVRSEPGEEYESLYRAHLELRAADGRFAFNAGNEHDVDYGYFFLHEFFSPSILLKDIDRVDRPRIQKKLERDGTVTGYVEGMRWDTKTSLPVLVELSGPLPHVARSAWYAEWLSFRRAELAEGLTFDIRAVAIASASVNSTFHDSTAVPPGLVLGDMRRTVIDAIEARRDGRDHVDGMILPTAACCSALMELGCAPEAEPLQSWLLEVLQNPKRKQQWLEDPRNHVEARVRLWLPDLPLDEPFRDWAERSAEDGIPSDVLILARALDKVQQGESIPLAVRRQLITLVSDASVPTARRAEIARFMITLARGSGHLVAELAGVAEELSRMLRIASSSGGGLEAVSLLTAALVELDAILPMRLDNGPIMHSSELAPIAEREIAHERNAAEAQVALQEKQRRILQIKRERAHHEKSARFFAYAFLGLYVSAALAALAYSTAREWVSLEATLLLGFAVLWWIPKHFHRRVSAANRPEEGSPNE